MTSEIVTTGVATRHRQVALVDLLDRLLAGGVVIQGEFTHTSKGGAQQTGGPGSVWSQPARQVHDDKCEQGADCVIVVYFHGKLDFISVDSPYRYE